MPKQPEPKAPPRIVVELSPKGDFIIETIENGSRSRIPLNRGEEWWEIRDILNRIARANAPKWVPSAYRRVGKPVDEAGKELKAPAAAPAARKMPAARKITPAPVPTAALPKITPIDELF
jgi:hypothetical protein